MVLTLNSTLGSKPSPRSRRGSSLNSVGPLDGSLKASIRSTSGGEFFKLSDGYWVGYVGLHETISKPVLIVEVSDTIATIGLWDHHIGNC